MKSLSKDDYKMKDPREALLSYNDKGDDMVNVAYVGNKKILATTTLEEDIRKDKEALKEKLK